MRPVDRMNCDEAFRRFNDYLDRELEPEETELVREHLEFCERCARELEFEASVLREVRAKMERLSVPSSLTERIARVLRDAGGEPEGL